MENLVKATKAVCLLFVLISVSAFAYDQHVYSDASRFIESAYQVAQRIDHIAQRSHLREHIHRVINKARHLRFSAKEGSTSAHLQSDFRSLQREFKRFVNAYKKAHDYEYRRLRRAVSRMTYRFYSLRESVYRSQDREERNDSWRSYWF